VGGRCAMAALPLLPLPARPLSIIHRWRSSVGPHMPQRAGSASWNETQMAGGDCGKERFNHGEKGGSKGAGWRRGCHVGGAASEPIQNMDIGGCAPSACKQRTHSCAGRQGKEGGGRVNLVDCGLLDERLNCPLHSTTNQTIGRQALVFRSRFGVWLLR
jgi:hypothetical protein